MLPGRELPRAPPGCCGPSRRGRCPPALSAPPAAGHPARLSPRLPARQLSQGSEPARNISRPGRGACLPLAPAGAAPHRLLLTPTRPPARRTPRAACRPPGEPLAPALAWAASGAPAERRLLPQRGGGWAAAGCGRCPAASAWLGRAPAAAQRPRRRLTALATPLRRARPAPPASHRLTPFVAIYRSFLLLALLLPYLPPPP